jgi:hypothetical protein
MGETDEAKLIVADTFPFVATGYKSQIHLGFDAQIQERVEIKPRASRITWNPLIQ